MYSQVPAPAVAPDRASSFPARIQMRRVSPFTRRAVLLPLAAASSLLAAAGALAAQDAPGGIDTLFRAFDTDSTPGCAAGVALGGRVLLRRGYGLASVEHGAPITPRTVFDTGSLAKQFTAAAVALLAEEGRLSLDDDVRKHVPELPAYGRPVTLRHLLHHTSGIRDYFSLLYMAGGDIEEGVGEEAVLDLLAGQRSLNFEPGDQHLYSNSGYFLLALVVKRVTGASMGRYAAEAIFRPLGMTSTLYLDDEALLVPQKAASYRERRDGTLGAVVLKGALVGDGGVYATLDDMLAWSAALEEGRLGRGGPGLLERLRTPGRLNSGAEHNYALGVRVLEYRGTREVSHGGTIGGYRSYLLHLPEHRFHAVVLCNVFEASPFQLAHRLADAYLGDRLAPPPPPQAPQAAVADSAAPWRPAPRDLAAYAGVYASGELRVEYRISAGDTALVARRGRRAPQPLAPSRPDTFRDAAGTAWAFTRDGAGRVTGLVLTRDRARNVAFVRVTDPTTGGE
jgi:YD repeat-containing protein